MRNDSSVRRLLLLALLGLVVIGLSGCTAEDDGNGTSGGGDDGIYVEAEHGDAKPPLLQAADPTGHDTLKYGHS